MDKILKLVKVTDYFDEHKFFYYVDVNNDLKNVHFFRYLVDAENFIKELGAKYEFEEYKDYVD